MPDKPTLYYIPHTHWEGAVFKTREEYLQMGLANILKAVDLLKKHPDFRFTLDQVAYIRPFVERYPEEAAAFRKFVKEGRLEIVGGMDVMPDVVKPGGELFVRQMQYGKKWCKDSLGVDVTVAWLLDTFGHHPQLPQLLKLAGFKSFWFCRGVPSNKMPSEFNWRGIDGTTIPAFWLPGFYGLFYGPPGQPEAFSKFFQDRYRYLDGFAAGQERVGLAGVDVSEPEDYVMPLVRQFNERSGSPFQIRTAVPSEFAAAVAKRKDVPTIDGDFSPIFQGTFSSRAELKQTTREIEQKLLNAEKLGALAACVGSPSEDSLLWRAWEPVLFNQTHDLSSGVMTDHVYEDVRRGYDFADKIGGEAIDSRLDSVLANVDTRGEGVPVAVFNTLGWPRTDVVETEVGFAGGGVRDVAVIDDVGKEIPCQIVRADYYSDKTLKEARIAFLARNVPSLGYGLYRVVSVSDPRPSLLQHGVGGVLQSDRCVLTLDTRTGAILSLDDESGSNVLSGPANVVSMEPDHGDLWELYRGLDGASYIAMTNKQPVPTPDRAILSTAYPAQKPGVAVSGPVYSEFTVSHKMGNGEYATRIRLYNGVRRVDIATELVNNEKYVRSQALFPTRLTSGSYVQEIPFGAVERPEGVENAAQNWVDLSDGRRGVAILNAGMPGNVMTGGTLMLSLMRSHNLGAYGFGGGYEPGMSSESGFEIGQRRSFHYAIVPHSGSWQQSGVFRDGLEFNCPLIARKTTTHTGSLPARWGMLEVSHPNVVLSSIKQLKTGTYAVRVYEASGTATPDVSIRPRTGLNSANLANLLDEPGSRIAVKDGAVQFDLHPFEIKTLILRIPQAVNSPKGGRNAGN